MATKLGKKITDDDDVIEVKGQQRSNVVKYVNMASVFLVRCTANTS